MLGLNILKPSESSVSVLDWRMMDPNHPMNALMRLNQIHPGLQYRLLSQSGPVHAPVFTMSVDIQGNTYQATGNSKRTAKLQVALKVFKHQRHSKTAVTVKCYSH